MDDELTTERRDILTKVCSPSNAASFASPPTWYRALQTCFRERYLSDLLTMGVPVRAHRRAALNP
jgi:hypothetical protein